MQRLRTQLEKAQGSMHSQELELERLRPLEIWLGQNQREQQVSRMVGTYTSSGRSKLGTHLKTNSEVMSSVGIVSHKYPTC